MKHLNRFLALFLITILCSCADDDDSASTPSPTAINFQFKSTINVGGEGSSEISAFDPDTNKLFTVNVESNEISVYDLSNLNSPVLLTPLSISAFGTPNSVSVYEGNLAVAVEAPVKQNPGQIIVFNTETGMMINQYTVGALPDMVTYSKDGNLLLSANEGEPNDDYDVDPMGTISIIDLNDDSVTILDFTAFNAQEATLESQGFRVFGPGADLATDVEPEYIAVSDDSQTAWVSLQENNGIARINLVSKTIEAIYPLGFKDYNNPMNSIDASDKDQEETLKNWPVFGMYQPDAITYTSINGTEYIISANEGDARDYDGFSEEERVEDLTLDETVFPQSNDYQNEVNLGRLKITTTLGDTDNDGDTDEIYNYGARSFSIWSTTGGLLYDSGNDISEIVLSQTPERFNWDWEDNETDKRSDDKGAEPEAVEVIKINEKTILFVGLERNSQVMVFDISNPMSPQYVQILQRATDYAPEGVLAVSAENSPSGKPLVIISNEDSGTISIYENEE
ncbi:choice-of-anchor I family protein [uncultured Psychroserpens sp.]|uniref:choice-of-anchor I family protein n=1 Tax=uncultured Psychroserpens sp. TaxID=255436 RepID=UPI0026094320|nr:choice-of-anchor I family protein [uncultured Psychroserpens sp.]